MYALEERLSDQNVLVQDLSNQVASYTIKQREYEAEIAHLNEKLRQREQKWHEKVKKAKQEIEVTSSVLATARADCASKE